MPGTNGPTGARESFITFRLLLQIVMNLGTSRKFNARYFDIIFENYVHCITLVFKGKQFVLVLI